MRDATSRAALLSLRHTIEHLTRHGRGTIMAADGALLFAGAHPGIHAYVNGALRLDPRLPAGEFVERARAFFTEQSRDFILWASMMHDPDVAEYAVAASLTQRPPVGGVPEMMLTRDPGPPELVPGLTIQRVSSSESVGEFVDAVSQAYTHGMSEELTRAIFAAPSVLLGDGVAAFVVRASATPVGCAMITICEDTAEAGFVGTLPDWRGRGIGAAVTVAAAHEGFALGASAVFLQASQLGEPVYQRIGFEEIDRYARFEVRFAR